MMSFDRQHKIAFLGMGLMGSRMATRLIQAGFHVAVWNRTASACAPLIDIGAHPLELADIAQYPIILICLADDHAVKAVFTQIEPYLKAKQVIVDFSHFIETLISTLSNCSIKFSASKYIFSSLKYYCLNIVSKKLIFFQMKNS